MRITSVHSFVFLSSTSVFIFPFFSFSFVLSFSHSSSEYCHILPVSFSSQPFQLSFAQPPHQLIIQVPFLCPSLSFFLARCSHLILYRISLCVLTFHFSSHLYYNSLLFLPILIPLRCFRINYLLTSHKIFLRQSSPSSLSLLIHLFSFLPFTYHFQPSIFLLIFLIQIMCLFPLSSYFYSNFLTFLLILLIIFTPSIPSSS
jgi:hypothetical protein